MFITDSRPKITVKFPREYKNWHIIINAAESYLKIHGFIPFVVPANVDDFITDPPMGEANQSLLIEHILLTLQNVDITQNGKASI